MAWFKAGIRQNSTDHDMEAAPQVLGDEQLDLPLR